MHKAAVFKLSHHRRHASMLSKRAYPERLSVAKESNGAMVAAESDEMPLAAVVKTRQSPWPEDNLGATS